ncbi:MAG: hypothetical protein E7355_05565 [Clostridiales bacterium]|nr:hypothetical protein [Clostridiales bacterium]
MKLKKLVSGILAVTATFGCVGMLTACETAHPEVRIEVSFNDESYTLDYKLYRKFAPATVNHFLKLAEEGYYDGLCVHNYADDRLYTGAYSFDEESSEYGGLVYKKYYDVVKNYENFPKSVYTEEGEATYTLCGEFADNQFEWEKGEPLKETYGSLTMFYTNKGANDSRVVVKHPDSEKDLKRPYNENSATSQFFISLAAAEKTNTKYCTFAVLEEDGLQELTKLQEAIKAYLEDNDEGSEKVSVKVDDDDAFVGNSTRRETYTVLSEAIVITSVKVTKT